MSDIVERLRARGEVKLTHNDHTRDLLHEAIAEITRLREENLRLLPVVGAALPTAGGAWRPTHRHYKGGVYRLIGVAKLEPDPAREYVVYDDASGNIWLRVPSDWSSTTESGWQRFTPLPAAPQPTDGEAGQ